MDPLSCESPAMAGDDVEINLTLTIEGIKPWPRSLLSLFKQQSFTAEGREPIAETVHAKVQSLPLRFALDSNISLRE